MWKKEEEEEEEEEKHLTYMELGKINRN